MIPLWTTAMRPLQSRCGWAFWSFTSPWVAQRVWPMPQLPASSSGTRGIRSRILPLRL